MTAKEKIQSIVDKYDKSDAPKVKATVDMLCGKGIGNGCYQDYAILADVVDYLCTFERMLVEKEDKSNVGNQNG